MKNKLSVYFASIFTVGLFSFIGIYIYISYTNPEQLADQTIQARDRLNQNLIFLSQNPTTLGLSYQHKENFSLHRCFTEPGACQEGEYYPFALISENGVVFSSSSNDLQKNQYDILGEKCEGDNCALQIKLEVACLKFCKDIKKSELKVKYSIAVTDSWKEKLKDYKVQNIESTILLPTLESFEKKIPQRKNLKSKSGQNVNQIGGYGD